MPDAGTVTTTTLPINIIHPGRDSSEVAGEQTRPDSSIQDKLTALRDLKSQFGFTPASLGAEVFQTIESALVKIDLVKYLDGSEQTEQYQTVVKSLQHRLKGLVLREEVVKNQIEKYKGEKQKFYDKALRNFFDDCFAYEGTVDLIRNEDFSAIKPWILDTNRARAKVDQVLKQAGEIGLIDSESEKDEKAFKSIIELVRFYEGGLARRKALEKIEIVLDDYCESTVGEDTVRHYLASSAIRDLGRALNKIDSLKRSPSWLERLQEIIKTIKEFFSGVMEEGVKGFNDFKEALKALLKESGRDLELGDFNKEDFISNLQLKVQYSEPKAYDGIIDEAIKILIPEVIIPANVPEAFANAA